MAATRRLAAIMFTDIVGFTALTQSDESRALRILEDHNRLLRPFFPQFHGKEIKTIGDSFLVEFKSALDATNCAIEIQRILQSLRVSSRDPETIRLRIGIHLGDVVHAKGDVLGDAVNIASRIEPLAEPGGICVSEQVFAEVRNKLSNPLVKLAPRELKNVQFPIDVYKIVLPWDETGPGGSGSGRDEAHRLAVLPFTNMSPDPHDEFFADGLTEEIITELSRVPGLRVIARTSVMRYKGAAKSVEEIGKELRVGVVLEGSVRKAGNRIRITAQLIDSGSQEHLWADRFDRDLIDIFEIQSEIAKNVAGSLGVKLGGVPLSERPPTKDLDAYSIYLKGRVLWNRRASDSVLQALACFKEAIAKDPEFAQAYSGVADCYSVLMDRSEIPWSDGGPKAMAAALKAVELNAELAEAHASLGLVFDGECEWESAEREYRRAIDLAPGYASAHHWYHMHLVENGRFEEAEKEIARAEEADPLSPVILMVAGMYSAFRKRDGEAVRKWDRAMEFGPGLSDWILFTKTLFYVSRDRLEEAGASLRGFESLVAGGGVQSKTDRIWMPAALHAALGRREEAKRALELLAKLVEDGEVTAGEVAALCAALGDADQFYSWLFRAIESRSVSLYNLRIHPSYETMRADSRFCEALRRCRVSD